MVDFNKLIDNHLARGLSYKKLGRYYPSEIARQFGLIFLMIQKKLIKY